MEKYREIVFKKNYSIQILEDFFKIFPEEKNGRKRFKQKEIQNTKLLIYDEILSFAFKIKANCIGQIKEKISENFVEIIVSYYR